MMAWHVANDACACTHLTVFGALPLTEITSFATQFATAVMLSLLCAAVGNGLQLSLLCIICIVMAILRHLYAGRGSTVTVFIVFYALTSVVGGFVSGSLYAQAAGPSWQRAMFLSATLFPGLISLCRLLDFLGLSPAGAAGRSSN